MRPTRSLRPDLADCSLEDRLSPVISNLGVIALTTGGYLLLTPFPGAFVSPSGGGAGPGSSTAASVSGTPINMPFFILGGGGISSALPGNITAVPSLGIGGPAGSTAPGIVIYLGSGADEANGSGITMVTRNTVANDLLNPPPLIGGQTTSTSSLLPPGPSGVGATPAASAPAPAAASPSMSETSGGSTMPPPGSSLNGPFVRFPAMFPRDAPLGFPVGSPPGAAPGGPTPPMPPRPGG